MDEKAGCSREYLDMEDLLAMIPGDNGRVCEKIYADCAELFCEVPGSSHNHQAWPGGYHDHVLETMNIARLLYGTMQSVRNLPFSLGDALLIMFLHDIEKPWKYELDEHGGLRVKDELKSKEAQREFRNKRLAEYGVVLTPEQENAMEYVEGEYKTYSNRRRVSWPLAAFCHMCDVASARIWFDRPDVWSAGRSFPK